MRILISAYACAPGRGSEPGVGWNWAAQVSRSHEVWVLGLSTVRQPAQSGEIQVIVVIVAQERGARVAGPVGKELA